MTGQRRTRGAADGDSPAGGSNDRGAPVTISRLDRPIDDALIAAFVDGRLTGEARSRVIDHLASHSDAYEAFASTLRDRQESVESEPGRQAEVLAFPIRRWAASIAAAAAMLLVLLVPRLMAPAMLSGRLLVQAAVPVGQEPDLIQRLDLEVAPPLLRAERPRVGSRALAALLGEAAVDLELSRAAGNPAAIDVQVERLLMLGELAGVSQDELALLADLQGDPTGEHSLEPSYRILARTTDARFFQAGQWVEAARFAAQVRSPHLFRHPSTRRALEILEQLPEVPDASRLAGLSRSLAAVDPAASDQDWRELGQTIELVGRQLRENAD